MRPQQLYIPVAPDRIRFSTRQVSALSALFLRYTDQRRRQALRGPGSTGKQRAINSVPPLEARYLQRVIERKKQITIYNKHLNTIDTQDCQAVTCV